MDIINTFKHNDTISHGYVSLDTTEGSCVGHWIWECAFFLPYIKGLQKTLPYPLKIVLHDSKQYKMNILSDFEFHDNDIVYSDKMIQDPRGNGSWQQTFVVPQESEYILHVPRFFYLWNTTIHTSLYFDYLTKFRNYYIVKMPYLTKSIPITYIARSRKENYKNNYREFINKEEIRNMLEKNGVNIVDTDSMNSFLPQFHDIMKSNTIIMEMGSAFTINAACIASNSHVIVLNDTWNYYHCDTPFFHIFRKLMKQRNNTVEIFSTGNGRDSFSIDEHKLETRICDVFLHRKFCIICNHSEFTSINSFPNFPIMAVSNSSITEQFFDFIPIVCNKCKCLQLQHQINPSILYSDVYMNSYFSPAWKDHHETFAKFILNTTNYASFLEIGANRGDLYTLLSKEKNIDYTTLDMFQHPELPPQVTFIKGSCDSFNFTGFTTIIASHVFEHLYTPLTFIEHLRNANVSEVFISIPNFDYLLKEQSALLINSQHIFYCGFEYIVYMFSLFKYRYEKFIAYDGDCKSYMFKFVLDLTIPPNPTPSTNIQLYKNIYVKKIQDIQRFQTPSNCYIAPSGIYGQFLYYFLNNKENIIGFLDNNTQRHGKKLYGTDKTVFDPHTIDYSNAIVMLCDCPYKEEIYNGLTKICDTIQFVYIQEKDI